MSNLTDTQSEMMESVNASEACVEGKDDTDSCEWAGNGVFVYRLTEEEVWAAESIEQAMEGAATHYGVPVWEVKDELFHPYKIKLSEAIASRVLVGDSAVPMKMAVMLLAMAGRDLPQRIGVLV